MEVRQAENPQEVIVDIRRGKGGLLIGHRAQTLKALKYLVMWIVGKKRRDKKIQLVVDTERYRERRRLEDRQRRLGG